MRSLNYFSILFVALLIIGCSSDGDDGGNTDNNDNNQQQQTEPKTSIPDPAFEGALVALGFDDVVDGEVITDNIDNVTSLVLNDQGISSISGIEDFTNLENLWINNNELESLPISTNTNLKFIFADFNQVTSLNVAALAILEKVSLIDNALTEINIQNNTALQQLVVPGNQITALDVSANPALTVLNVVNNPLTCIQVAGYQQSDIPEEWETDPEDSYALNCN